MTSCPGVAPAALHNAFLSAKLIGIIEHQAAKSLFLQGFGRSKVRGAKIIRIEIEETDTGMVYATSPEMSELNVGRTTIDGLMEALPQAISAIMAHHGHDVRVYPLEDESDVTVPPPWVIVPAQDQARAH